MTIGNSACRPVRRAQARPGYRFRPSAFLPPGPHLARQLVGVGRDQSSSSSRSSVRLRIQPHAAEAPRIALPARKRKTVLPAGIEVDAEVDLNVGDDGQFLSARRDISLSGIDRTTAQALIDEAHRVCPYSKATRRNIDVAINMV